MKRRFLINCVSSLAAFVFWAYSGNSKSVSLDSCDQFFIGSHLMRIDEKSITNVLSIFNFQFLYLKFFFFMTLVSGWPVGLRLAPKDRPVNPRRSRRSPPRVIQRCWPATCNWTSGRARVKCPYWARRPSRATSASGGPRTLDLPKKGQRAR